MLIILDSSGVEIERVGVDPPESSVTVEDETGPSLGLALVEVFVDPPESE